MARTTLTRSAQVMWAVGMALVIAGLLLEGFNLSSHDVARVVGFVLFPIGMVVVGAAPLVNRLQGQRRA